MGDTVDLVSRALRDKLLRQGARSLTPVEWHLLRVSHYLAAVEDRALDRILADTPLNEILALADGLDAIVAREAATTLRDAAAEVADANDPGLGPQRADIVADISRRLSARVAGQRPDIERRLLEYAFRQQELSAEAAPGS